MGLDKRLIIVYEYIMTTKSVAIGGRNAVAFVKDREPIFDEETGTFICGEELVPGRLCQGIPVAPRWRCRRHGGDWKPTDKALAAKAISEASIYDPQRLWSGYENIRRELTAFPELVAQLYDTDLGEELAITRIMVSKLLRDENGDQGIILKAIRLVGKIAKDAKEIREKQNNIITQEFMDGIIAAITLAFIRANGYLRPSDRARVFTSEFAALLPGNPDLDLPVDEDIYEGEVVNAG